MKAGISLTELAIEIDRQSKTKRDFTAPAALMRAVAAGPGEMGLDLFASRVGESADRVGSFNIGPIWHEQAAGALDIPLKYYRRMLADAPHLLSDNLNHWLSVSKGKHMLRTLDGQARALLSSRYRPIDHLEILETVLPLVHGIPDAEVLSCNVSERRLHLKVLTPRVRGEVAKGDEVQAGFVLSNSETGDGALRVEPMIYRLICLNGAIAPDTGLKRYHVGSETGGEGAEEYYRPDTLRAADRALLLRVRDTVNAAVDEVQFRRTIGKWQAAKGLPITGHLEKVVEVTKKRLALAESEAAGILRHLIGGGDLSQYGLMNAITRHSQDVSEYDRATALERMGPAVLELPRSEWREIAEAA